MPIVEEGGRLKGYRSTVLLLLVAVFGACATPAWAQAGIDADQVAAAFVFRFPQFVEWPPSALEGRESLDICVAEPNPFGTLLQRLVRAEVLEGRRLEVRDVNAPADLEGCHVLYMSSATQRSAALLRAASDRPILTIGESADFLDSGGIITFRIINRRIRFAVDMETATRVGLELSSQLLALAVEVRGAVP